MANEAKDLDLSTIPAAYKAQLSHYLQFIRLEKGLSAHSVQSYEHDLKRYFQFLVHHTKIHDIAGVTMTHIESFLHYLIERAYFQAAVSSQHFEHSRLS